MINHTDSQKADLLLSYWLSSLMLGEKLARLELLAIQRMAKNSKTKKINKLEFH